MTWFSYQKTLAFTLILRPAKIVIMKTFDDEDLKFYNMHGFFVSNFPILKGETLNSFQKLSSNLVDESLERQKRAFVDDLHIKHGDFIEFALNYDLLDMVESVIGSNFGLAWSAALIKNKNSDFGLSWHSDFSEGEFHQGLKDHPCISVTIAATRSTRESGCIQFISGSHKDKAKEHVPVASERLHDVRLAELSPGCFTLHNPHTLHSSNSNLSDYDRILINFWYISTDVSKLSEEAVQFLKAKSAGRIHLRGSDLRKICALSVNDYL